MSDSGDISIKGVLLGALTDIGGTIVFGVIISIIMVSRILGQGYSEAELEQQLLLQMQSNNYLFMSLTVGLAFTCLGGYVAARVAKRREYLHASIVGGIAILFCLWFSGQTPLWLYIISLLLSIPAALLGAWFVLSRDKTVS